MFIGIRRRLAGWNVLVLAMILVLVGGVVYASLSASLMAEVDRNLASRSDGLMPSLEEAGEHLGLGREGYSGSVFYIVTDSSGQILANPQQVDTTGMQLNFQASGPYFQTQTVQGETTRLYVRPLQLRHGPTILTFVVGQSLVPEEQTLQRLLMVLLIAGGAGLLLSLAGAWFLAGRALIPIQLAFRRQMEFVADASHELRTPLTVMKAAAELMNRHRAEPLEANGELFDDLRMEIGRLERLSRDLLTLARSDLSETDLAVGEVDLANLAGEVTRRTAPLAQEKGITLSYECQEKALVSEGDPDRLQQLLLILLDNALKHTPVGGSVSVVVRRRGHEGLISVADTGEGIDPEHLPRVFDRFYRGDKSRSRAQGSAGLGLAIAKAIVDAHGGHLGIESAVGSGTTATVRLRLLEQQVSLAGKLGQLASRVTGRSPR